MAKMVLEHYDEELFGKYSGKYIEIGEKLGG